MQKRYLLYVLGLTLSLSACKSGGDLTTADKAFREEQYKVAIDNYKGTLSSIKDKKKRAEVTFKIAEALRLNSDYRQAENWYNKAITSGYEDPIVYYRLGQVLKMNEKYEEALVQFEKFAKEAPSDSRGNEEAEFVKQTIEFRANPNHPCSRFEVESFKQTNTSANEYSPMILPKEGLIFTSDREEAEGKRIYGRTGISYGDLFILKRVKKGREEKWSPPPTTLEGDVNSDYNEGTATFDAKGNIMYYTQCNGTDGKKPNCVIMMARKKGKEWGDAEVLPFCNDTTIDYGHPTLSPDGNKLVFSMDGPGSVGGKDLYITTYVKRSRTWSDPVNLGEVVNTAGEEVFPYFYNDTTLFFSSDGHMNLGGLDIFVTYGTGETWTKPENLLYPLNSGGDDFGIVFNDNGESGYFTSNRPKSRGDDIYTFMRKPLVFTLSGVVYDQDTKKPLNNAVVTLVDNTGNTKATVKTDETGGYKFKLNKESDYLVSAERDMYLGSSEESQTTKGLKCSKDLVQDLYLSRSGFEVKGIYYDLDKADLRPESKNTLDSLFQIMTDYPKLIIELGSHTDCRASEEYNQDLSQRRAQSVVDYMIGKGIPAGRMVAKGYGETQLVNNCKCDRTDNDQGIHCTEEEHQANRRTTVKVLSFDYKP